MNFFIFFKLNNLIFQSNFLDNIIWFFAVPFVYIMIIISLIFILFKYKIFSINDIKNNLNKFFKVIFSTFTAWFVAKILKIIIHTPRPNQIFNDLKILFNETGYAFPSGHTATAFAVAFSVFFINKKYGLVFLILALFIGLSRIISGVHFPVDILGGFVVGFLVAFLVKRL